MKRITNIFYIYFLNNIQITTKLISTNYFYVNNVRLEINLNNYHKCLKLHMKYLLYKTFICNNIK